MLALVLSLVIVLTWGSAPHPGSVARGDPEAPRRSLFTWGSAPHPGSVARGGPEAPRRSLAGAPCAPRVAQPAGELAASRQVLTWGSAPHPGSVARGGPEAPRRSLAGAPCAPRVAQPAGELAASRHSDPVPGGVAAAIAQKLAPGGTRVTSGGATITFWFVSGLPLKGGTPVASWDVDEGSLVGVVTLDKDYRDVRGRVVRSGTYTLRYGIQPANGDHLGVSPFRDFLLLSLVAEDTDPAPRGHDGTVELSKHTIGGSHPAVWSIDPPAASEAPLAVHTTDLGHKAIVMEVPVTHDGKPAGTLRFGIVLVGKIEA